ncbi:MAG: filamentous hemagglutinin N-terminal domain-containing protein [Planctomycetes bacterium]|nr:filamentous hemagglutinin N-terminal domain-containing protein [Planctomycetota bacterium]
MEKVRKVVKKYYLRQILTYWLACWMFFGLPAQVAMAANPVVTDPGTATITQGTDWTNVLVNESHSVIDWSNFNTDPSELMAFEQGALINSAVLNRITGGTTNFKGDLTGAGMRIFMINPAGIIFGPTATVNVSQLVASALNMDPDDFLKDNMVFQGGDGIVSNFGTINATDSVYLLGGDVYNWGTISSPGDVILVATMNDKVIITKEGSDVLVKFDAPEALATSDVQNGHDIGYGDIWSYALVEARQITAKAERDITIEGGDMLATGLAASDAVAKIDLIAGGNVTIEGSADVTATAIGNGVDNATATVNIEAGTNVDIVPIVEAYVRALAYDGTTNTATLNITANDGHVQIFADDAYARVDTYAHNGVDNIANVNITAKSKNVDDPSNAWVNIAAVNGGTVYSFPLAEDAENSNSAALMINADAFVQLSAQDNSTVWVGPYAQFYKSKGSTVTNTAGTTVNAGSYVDVIAVNNSHAEINSYATFGNDNKATVDIDATGDLNVEGGSIKAYAGYTYSGNAIAAVTVEAANVNLDDSQMGADAYAEEGLGNATATVDITMVGSDAGVAVENDSWIWTCAETYDGAGNAVSEIAIQDVENVTVNNHAGIYAEAETGDGSGNAIAAVDVDATGNVLVNGGENPSRGDGHKHTYSGGFFYDSGDAMATPTVASTNKTVNPHTVT